MTKARRDRGARARLGGLLGRLAVAGGAVGTLALLAIAGDCAVPFFAHEFFTKQG